MHLIRFWIILNKLRPSYSISVVQRDKKHCIQESTESEEDEKMADRGGGKRAQIKGGTD